MPRLTAAPHAVALASVSDLSLVASSLSLSRARAGAAGLFASLPIDQAPLDVRSLQSRRKN